MKLLVLAVLVLAASINTEAEAGDLAALVQQRCTRNSGPVRVEQEAQTAVEQATAAVAKASKHVSQAKPADKTAAQQSLDRANDELKEKRQSLEQASVRAQQAFRALCEGGIPWDEASGHEYPKQYLSAKYQVDVCAKLEVIDSAADDIAERQSLCGGGSHETGSGFEAVAISLVGGLGDLLQAEAKQSALEYLLGRVGKKFCELTVEAKGTKIEMKTWFEKSCKAILPNGSIDVDAFTFGALKTAFEEDVRALPPRVAEAVKSTIVTKWPKAPKYASALGVIAIVLKDAFLQKRPLDILNEVGDLADKQLAGLRCDLSDPANARKECVALLAFVVVRSAANELKVNPTDPRISKLLSEAIDDFCNNHGIDGKKTNGACVVDKDKYEEWHTHLLELYRAAKEFLDLEQDMKHLADSALPGEINKRAAPELIRSLRNLIEKFGTFVAAADPTNAKTIEQDFALILMVMDTYDAIVADDPGAVRKVILDVLGSEIVKNKLGAQTTHRLTVIVSLATAKDRDEVKGILEDVTAPVGTYKAKYGATHVLLTLNGFVGFFVGQELRLHSRTPMGAPIDAVHDWAPMKLSSPVGFDATVKSGEWLHIGLTATVIDPLALAVSTADDSLDADWKTLFEPGLYLRFGIAKSPFVLALGGKYQWARRSDEMCGTDRCFDGAFQFGALLSIDVPLLIVR